MDRTPQRLQGQAGRVLVWHPENLNVDSLRERYGQRVAEGVLWLGHCVYMGLTDDARCRDTGKVPLMAQYLHNVIGRHHVDAVRRAAFEVGYVDRDRSYCAGVRSQIYLIRPRYHRARLVRREVADFGLRHNIHRWREERRRATWQRIQCNGSLVDAAVCAHLWRNLHRIQIDATIDLGQGFHPLHQIAVEHIRDRDFWFTLDDYGRIHTNVTNLSKGLRQFLAVDGKRLVDVDVSESQPLFLGMAIAQCCKGREGGSRNKQQGTTDRDGVPSLMFDNTMFDKNPQLEGGFDRDRLPADVRRYLELVEARGL